MSGRAMRLNNIGMVCKAMGRYTDALKYCEEALNILRELGLNETRRAAPYKKNIENLKDLLFTQDIKKKLK